MRMLKFLTAAAIGAIALTTSAVAQQTKLVFNTFLPPKHPFNVQVLTPWAADIEKATEGRVKIEIPPTSAAPPPQIMDAAQKGIIDGGFQFNAFVGNRVKLGQLPHLPWGSGSAEAMSVAYWRTYEKFFAGANEYKDFQLIGLFCLAPAELASLKEPIRSAKDLEGKKVWALPGTAAKLMEGMKSGVIATPAVRSHEVISAGQVDAFAGIAASDMRAFNLLQYAKSITNLPGKINSPSFSMFFNKAKWDSLSAADRDAITKLSGEAFAKRLSAIDAVEKEAWAELARLNVPIIEAPADLVADFKKASQPIEDAWLADAKSANVDGPAALAFYRDTVKQLTK